MAGGTIRYSVLVLAIFLLVTNVLGRHELEEKRRDVKHRHAYAAMMYMGTPRDYEFYVALRVMMRSLAKFQVQADRVVIASSDVPVQWVQAMEKEDGLKVVTVTNLKNPYEFQGGFNPRFKLTMNKLYAWSLFDYDRVVMLDSDNLFLQNTDELFQCGQFCAVFINPCIFHTGLFVLQPSKDVFNNMVHELEIGRNNPDGADQGFLVSYFPDLLDQPLFHPPANGTKVNGTYRLPLGYQMDASYYYLKLKWNVPCGPNSVVTFPSAPWFKPWYWWSWPVLPLGFSWHELRRSNLGYASELPLVLIEAALYISIIIVAKLAKPTCSKLCYNRRPEKCSAFMQVMLKVLVLWSMAATYTVPFFLIPRTAHPLMGWPLYLLGTLSLAIVVSSFFVLPSLAVLTTWIGLAGSLFVMACPWYSSGIVRALAVFGYACGAAPFVWASLVKILDSMQTHLEREPYYPRLGEVAQGTEFSKLY
ncbi:putative glucuronosyltransferase PGSIP8 [Carex rostrata]